MFRRVYKSANDDIVPDNGLLEKILAESNKPQKKQLNYYGYGSLAACLAIAVGTLFIYPTLKEDIKPAQDIVVSDAAPRFSDTELSNPSVLPTEAAPVMTEKTETSEEKINFDKVEKKTNSDNGKQDQTAPQTENKVSKTSSPEKAAASAEGLKSSSPSPTKKTEDEPESIRMSVENNKAEPEPDFQESKPMLAAEAAIVNADEPEAANQEDQPAATPKSVPSLSGGSGGGGSSAASARTSQKISESEAKQIANNIFASDFGQEFINSSGITAVYSGYYTITRNSESASYTIIVYDDGTTKKLY